MSVSVITASNLIDQFLLYFPEIKDAYSDELRSWDGQSSGNYNFVGFVVKPYIRAELEGGKVTDSLIRLAAILESICASGDIEAINVIWLKIFKLLLGTPSYLKLIWPLLGPLTQSNLEDAARRWNVFASLPAAP